MRDYLPNTSPRAERLVTFRDQMADFARGERLRQLREARHLSQEDAAHELNVSVKTVRSWEKGSGIRWPNAQAAGDFYGVDPETLIRREGREDTPDVLSALTPDSDLLREVAGQVARLAGIVEKLEVQVQELSRRIPEPGKGSGGS